jgi:hypothetical protein
MHFQAFINHTGGLEGLVPLTRIVIGPDQMKLTNSSLWSNPRVINKEGDCEFRFTNRHSDRPFTVTFRQVTTPWTISQDTIYIDVTL